MQSYSPLLLSSHVFTFSVFENVVWKLDCIPESFLKTWLSKNFSFKAYKLKSLKAITV